MLIVVKALLDLATWLILKKAVMQPAMIKTKWT